MSSPLGPGDLVLCAATVKETPFLDRLAPARAQGFRGVSVNGYDVGSARKAGLSTSELGARVADEGLAVAEFDAVTSWLPRHATDDARGRLPMRDSTAERVCPIAGEVGARSISVVELLDGVLEVDEAAEGFARVCDVAADHDLMVCLEFLPWGGVPTLARAVEVVRAADRANGSVLVDSWHLFRSGASVADLAAAPGELVGYVQIDDAPVQPEAEPYLETMHRRRLPGDGDFDLVGFVRALAEIGYAGPLGVEVISDDFVGVPVDEVARRCADATRAVQAAAR
jgi:sugar phosphate isomerase/epimerase